MHVLPSLGVLEPFESVASFQSFLVSAGRFLLTLAMSLFVSYLVFMVGSVVGSVLSRQVRTLASGITPAKSDDAAQVSRNPTRDGGRAAVLATTSSRGGEKPGGSPLPGRIVTGPAPERPDGPAPERPDGPAPERPDGPAPAGHRRLEGPLS